MGRLDCSLLWQATWDIDTCIARSDCRFAQDRKTWNQVWARVVWAPFRDCGQRYARAARCDCSLAGLCVGVAVCWCR